MESLRNSRDRMKASVNVKSHNFIFFIALLMIFIMALVMRITPIIRGYELIKAFDPWMQWYNAEYLDTHSLFEYFNWFDDKSWNYNDGVYRYVLRPGLPFTVVIIHQILTFLGIPISLYEVCYYFPAVMGAISVIVMYFLGKEIMDKKCGLMAAFFMAFSVGYMSRTMAGFFDNETIGVFGALMALLFFIKAYRTGKLIHTVIGGLSLGYVALSWGGYTFVMFIFPIIVFVAIVTKKYNENMLIAYVGIEGIGALIYSLYILFDPAVHFFTFEIGAIFFSSILLIIYHILYVNRSEYPRFYRNFINFLKWGTIPVILIAAVIIWVAPDILPTGLSSRLMSILNPLLRNSLALVASIAEHIPSPWSSFYHNTLIPLLLVPLGIYFCFKRGNVKDILLIVTTLTLFYFTGSMVRVILLFAPIASLMGAYGLVNVLNIHGSFIGENRASGRSRKRQRQAKNRITNAEVFGVYFVIGFICFAQVTHAVDTSINQLSGNSMVLGTNIHDWEQSLSWMRNNLDGDTVVVSWWDYGYWLTPIGNVTTVCDNGNLYQRTVGLVGMGMMQTNEIYAAEIFKMLGADYVLVYFTYLIEGLGGDEGKWQWMLRICNDNYEYYKSIGLEKDNWADGAVFNEDEYADTETGVKGKKWFESTIAKLMFYGVPTEEPYSSYMQLNQEYNNRINKWKDQDNQIWKENIPDNGDYQSNVFIPVYFGEETDAIGPSSTYGLIKMFKVDYTVLESSFEILDARVFDSGYGTFKLNNTGTKDLTITSVKVNDGKNTYSLGKGINDNVLPAGEEDTVWVNLDNVSHPLDSLVNIEVTAVSQGIERPFEFSENTGNFWVTEAEEGDITLNEQNCRVERVTDDLVNIFLEVENTGPNTVTLEKIYVDDETNDLIGAGMDTTYFNGSSILASGDTAVIQIADVPSYLADFYPVEDNHHIIGISTPNGIKDELLLSLNERGFNLTIYDPSRIASPEALIAANSSSRYHLPISFDATRAITYDNGTTQVLVKVKYDGPYPVMVNPIYITNSGTWTEVHLQDFNGLSGDRELLIGEEDTFVININESKYFDINVNDELGIKIIGSGSGGNRTCSAVTYMHTISDDESIQIIDNVESSLARIDSVAASYLMANESARVLVKNTGDTDIEIDVSNIVVNGSLVEGVEFVYGDENLTLQECAVLQFNVNGTFLDLSKTSYIEIEIGTTTMASDNTVLPVNYNIEIDEAASNATVGGNLNVVVNNLGLENVTINALYVNGTNIALSNFTVNFEIEQLTGNVTLTMDLNDLANALDVSIIVGTKLEILVRTEENAEDYYIITVA
ncbi:MAG: STT3 domain-containing protein [Promethearchaeota archaeon]